MLRILGKATSINVRKVLWTCRELGISFEREDWGSGFQSTSLPEFLARPVLPAIDAYLSRLDARPGWREFGANGIP